MSDPKDKVFKPGYLGRIAKSIGWFWHTYIKSDFVTSHDRSYVDEVSFRRTSAFFLGITVIGLLLISVVLNLLEGNYTLILPLLVVMAVPFISLVWLFRDRKSAYGPLFLILIDLTALGGFLLMWQAAPGGASLFWFVLFPPMAIFCLGVRYGSAIFAIFYMFLLMVMLGPWQHLLVDPMPVAMRERFLLSLLGSYIFAGFSEFIRAKTNRTLLRLMDRLEQEALTDPLTGLGNRRDFQNNFQWVTAKSGRYNLTFALAMVDIDHFKNINDSHGHDVGDKVLVHMTGLIMEHMRSTDRLFRWGGEEFIILMPDIHPEDAIQVAERIRQVIAESPCGCDDKFISYTISMGLFCCRGTADVNDALSIADQNLYTAKQQGRNQIVAGPCLQGHEDFSEVSAAF